MLPKTQQYEVYTRGGSGFFVPRCSVRDFVPISAALRSTRVSGFCPHFWKGFDWTGRRTAKVVRSDQSEQCLRRPREEVGILIMHRDPRFCSKHHRPLFVDDRRQPEISCHLLFFLGGGCLLAVVLFISGVQASGNLRVGWVAGVYPCRILRQRLAARSGEKHEPPPPPSLAYLPLVCSRRQSI